MTFLLSKVDIRGTRLVISHTSTRDERYDVRVNAGKRIEARMTQFSDFEPDTFALTFDASS